MRILPKHPTPLSGILLAATAFVGTAFAQTGLTTIQDTLFKADGTHFSGTLTIQWSTFDATNIGTIVQQSKSVDIVNGNLYVQLVPNAGAQAPANVYTVHYQSDGSQQFTETWAVPTSSTPLTVADVRTGMLTSGRSRQRRRGEQLYAYYRVRRNRPLSRTLANGLSKGPASAPARCGNQSERTGRNGCRRCRRMRLCRWHHRSVRLTAIAVLRRRNRPAAWWTGPTPRSRWRIRRADQA